MERTTRLELVTCRLRINGRRNRCNS